MRPANSITLLTERQIAALDRRFERGEPDACWLWNSRLDKDGYGIYRVQVPGEHRQLQFRAHRLMYEREHGPIPPTLTIDHLCLVRACVNPRHMEVVTAGVNVQRERARRPRPTHCKRGHEFTPENTLWHSGRRRCRDCNARRFREMRARRKAEGRAAPLHACGG